MFRRRKPASELPGSDRIRRGVFLAIPTHSNKLSPQTELAISIIKIEASLLGYEFQECRWVGDCYIPRARSILLAKFLESGLSDIFWLDDDVGCAPGTFMRMMRHKADFVAGAYRVKIDVERYPVRYLSKPELQADPATGLLELAGVPFGFVRFTRTVAEKMVRAHEDLWFHIHEEPELKVWCLFDTALIDHQYFGEDFLFCKRLRAIGIKVWVDPEILLHHTSRNGEKIYSGVFGQWLRQRETKPVLTAEALDALRAKLADNGPYAELLKAAAGEAA